MGTMEVLIDELEDSSVDRNVDTGDWSQDSANNTVLQFLRALGETDRHKIFHLELRYSISTATAVQRFHGSASMDSIMRLDRKQRNSNDVQDAIPLGYFGETNTASSEPNTALVWLARDSNSRDRFMFLVQTTAADLDHCRCKVVLTE